MVLYSGGLPVPKRCVLTCRLGAECRKQLSCQYYSAATATTARCSLTPQQLKAVQFLFPGIRRSSAAPSWSICLPVSHTDWGRNLSFMPENFDDNNRRAPWSRRARQSQGKAVTMPVLPSGQLARLPSSAFSLLRELQEAVMALQRRCCLLHQPLVLHINSLLSLQDLLNLEAACKSLRELLRDVPGPVWKQLLSIKLPAPHALLAPEFSRRKLAIFSRIQQDLQNPNTNTGKSSLTAELG